MARILTTHRHPRGAPHQGRRGLAMVTAAAGCLALPLFLPTAGASADTSPGPNVLPTCAPENFPHPGAPRSAPDDPYQIPFTATLGPTGQKSNMGGYLEINSPNSPFTVTMGGPIGPNGDGSLTATACGLVALPNESGGIPGLLNGKPHYGSSGNHDGDAYNDNFAFNNPVSISIGFKGVGVSVLQGYGSAVGFLASSIDRTPAANGGLNVEFESSAKATSTLSVGALCGLSNLAPAPVTAPTPPGAPNPCTQAPSPPGSGSDCTVPIGDLRLSGVPTTDFKALFDNAPNAIAEATTPVHLSTRFVTKDGKHGQPVTGPITKAQAVLVANDFPVAKIDPNTPPSANFPQASAPKSTLCTPSNANKFNQLLGLPSPAGANTFYAPGTFSVFTSS